MALGGRAPQPRLRCQANSRSMWMRTVPTTKPPDAVRGSAASMATWSRLRSEKTERQVWPRRRAPEPSHSSMSRSSTTRSCT
eukprot:2788200-Prymnesium_polylepis.2